MQGNPVYAKIKFAMELELAPVALERAEVVVGNLMRRVQEALSGAATVTMPGPMSVEQVSDLGAIVRGTTATARAFLRVLAESSPKVLTAADLADRLGLPKPVSIAGLTSGLTRKQTQLQRAGLLAAPIELFQEHWDGARMAYSMTEEQAARVLEELQKAEEPGE